MCSSDLVFEAHFVDEFGHKAVYHAMSASGAVVCDVVGEESRPGVYLSALGNNFFRCHIEGWCKFVMK